MTFGHFNNKPQSNLNNQMLEEDNSSTLSLYLVTILFHKSFHVFFYPTFCESPIFVLVGMWTYLTLFQSLLSLAVRFHSCIIIFHTHADHDVQLLVSVVLSIYTFSFQSWSLHIASNYVSPNYPRDASVVRTYVYVPRCHVGVSEWSVGPGTEDRFNMRMRTTPALLIVASGQTSCSEGVMDSSSSATLSLRPSKVNS